MAKATSADTKQQAKAAAGKPAKQSAKASKPAKPEKPSIFARLGSYFRGVRTELQRVVWPNRQEVWNSSVVVVMTLIFFITFALVVDQIVIQVIAVIDKIPSPFQ